MNNRVLKGDAECAHCAFIYYVSPNKEKDLSARLFPLKAEISPPSVLHVFYRLYCLSVQRLVSSEAALMKNLNSGVCFDDLFIKVHSHTSNMLIFPLFSCFYTTFLESVLLIYIILSPANSPPTFLILAEICLIKISVEVFFFWS